MHHPHRFPLPSATFTPLVPVDHMVSIQFNLSCSMNVNACIADTLRLVLFPFSGSMCLKLCRAQRTGAHVSSECACGTTSGKEPTCILLNAVPNATTVTAQKPVSNAATVTAEQPASNAATITAQKPVSKPAASKLCPCYIAGGCQCRSCGQNGGHEPGGGSGPVRRGIFSWPWG